MTMRATHNSSSVHLVRPGALETNPEVLLPLRETFDMLMMGAPTLAVHPKSAARFLKAFSPMKPYIVDPKTYALARSPKFIRSRPSWRILLKLLDIQESELPLGPNLSDAGIRQLVSRTLAHQHEWVPKLVQMSVFDLLDEATIVLKPEALVAPYFLFGGPQDPWFDTNLRLLDAALDERGAYEVLGTVFLALDTLSRPEDVDAIAEAYTRKKVSGFLIWIAAAAENQLTLQQITQIGRLASSLARDGRPVINMYGGYLSALLSHSGLTGFCHSPTGAERRGVDPPTGGKQDVLYYVPALHGMRPANQVASYLERIGVSDALSFSQTVCKCAVCRKAVERGLADFVETFAAPVVDLKSLTTHMDRTSMRLAALHYLLAKRREIVAVHSRSVSDLVAELQAEAIRFRDPAGIKAFSTQHLRIWAQALTELTREP